MSASPRSDSVAERIAELIRAGEVRPGQRLPSERRLALRLGVGRPAIREALRGLERSRIIEIQHRRGAFVNRFHPDQLISRDLSIIAGHVGLADRLHVVEVRRVAETALAGFAAQRRSAGDLAALSGNNERMRAAVAGAESIIALDVEFHELVADAAGNPVFARMLRSIRDLLISSLEITSRTPAAADRALAFHLGIYQAIERGDAAAARQAMDVHLDDVEALLLRESAHHGGAIDDEDRPDGGTG